MNPYQRQVAEIDHRHQLMIRSLSFIGMAALAAVTLWVADFPPAQWWARVRAGDVSPTGPSPAVAPGNESNSAAPVFPTDVSVLPPAEVGADSALSPTPQPLFVVSTAPGRNATEGTARIGTNPDHPQTYVAGAILANGARLVEIHPDRVVLGRGGETLVLYVSGDKRAAAPLASRDGSNELAMVGGGLVAPPVALAEDHLADVIRSMPYYENDQLVGMRISAGRSSVVFSQLGLMADDVVIAQDGSPIADAASATEILRMLTQGLSIAVTVRRGGKTRTISLDGAIVAQALSKREPARAETLPAPLPQ